MTASVFLTAATAPAFVCSPSPSSPAPDSPSPSPESSVRAFRTLSGKTWHDVAGEDVARELAACHARLEQIKRQIRSLERLESQMRAWQRLRGY